MTPNLVADHPGRRAGRLRRHAVLERSLTRVLIGFVLLGNGINLLFLVISGPAGTAPDRRAVATTPMSDPLPQAMVLTAIVITLGVTAFLLALAYRAWQLTGHDDVQDDVEDDRDPPARRAGRDLGIVRRGRHRAA